MAANQDGSLQVPSVQGYDNSRRGSGAALTSASGETVPGNYSWAPPTVTSTPTSLPSSQAYPLSSQLDHLSHELQFFEARLDDHSLQYDTDKLHRVQDLLRNCLTKVETTIESHVRTQNLTSMPPPSPNIASQRVRYCCLLCPLESQRMYSTTGTFKRHVEDKHWARYQYQCHLAGCPFTARRKDKMKAHWSKFPGHIISGTLSAHMSRRLVTRMPAPSACWLCPRAVNCWDNWFTCIANHCRIPLTQSDALSRRSSHDHDNNNGNNGGGSGGGGGNVFDRDFLDYFTWAMGAQFDSPPGNGFFGAGVNNHCAGWGHSSIEEETSEDSTNSDGSSLADSEAESLLGPVSSSEEPEFQPKKSHDPGFLETREILSIDLPIRPGGLDPHDPERKKLSQSETICSKQDCLVAATEQSEHITGDAGPPTKAPASTCLAKSERRPTLQVKANVVRQLLALQSAAAHSRQVADVTEDVDISVLDPNPNLSWVPKPAIDLIVLEPSWFLKQLIEPFLAECEYNRKSSPFWLAASRFLESILNDE